MRIVSFPESSVPGVFREQVVALHASEWPGSSSGHDPLLDPVSLLLLDGDEVVATLDILSKPIVHAEQTFQASGLSAVVTRGDRRGRGYGKALVAAALRSMVDSVAAPPDLGIFTCDRPLRAFYEAAGWECLPGTVLIGGTPDDPFPSDQFDKVTMGAFFSPRAVHLRSAFVGARVALFPGVIDRLW
ncbi:GNAT family N-acetyltransferase [Herbidospora daliensis]|uniref:GNAT family N-acetyltransferase n=1 Tax=Herbidospora daliensis TaxID=295585 RepID=UPI0007857FA9|nr:GNAT family N-acetyltransferase [Herbidospora daliensis]